MIHPSYVELMNVVNKTTQTGEAPVINSRYSIVAATAKRARQIIDGSEPMVPGAYNMKPLSIAVKELYEGQLRILTDEEAATKDLELIDFRQREAERREREALLAMQKETEEEE